MPRADIVLNRRARHLQGDTAVRRAVLEAARAANPAAHVHETTTLAELDAVMDVLSARGASTVVLVGGDGTHMAGVTALARAFAGRPLPPLGLAPGGTVGTVARNWSGAGRTWVPLGARGMASAAAAVVRAACLHARDASAAPTTCRPTLHVVDGRGGDHVGFIFGAGLVAGFFDVYDASPRKGYGGAARIVLRLFAGSFAAPGGAREGSLARRVLTPTPCTLAVDGVLQAPRAFSLIAASVVPDLGLGMRLLYRAAESPSRFHAVASALGPRALGSQMPRVLAGLPLRGDHHVDTLARELCVTFPEGEGAFVLDGEVLRAPEVHVTAGPTLTILDASTSST